MNKIMFIKVKTQFEGFHRWDKAPKEVSFLRQTHRHLFYVTATIEVSHSNRDIEYFMCQRYINLLFKAMKKKLGVKASCEQMASYIHSKLTKKYRGRFIRVEVSEDQENGSIVESPSKTVEVAAYLAGIIDGEGSIGLYKVKQKDCLKGFRLAPKVTIVNTNKLMVYKIRAILALIGVKIVCTRVKTKNPRATKRNVYYIQFGGYSNIKNILELVLPYLTARRQQASILYRYCIKKEKELKRKRDRSRLRISKSDLEVERKLKRLKKRDDSL